MFRTVRHSAKLKKICGIADRKSEIRNPKSDTNSNSGMPEIRNNAAPASRGWLRRISDFKFRICFGFRISDFGFDPSFAFPRLRLPQALSLIFLVWLTGGFIFRMAAGEPSGLFLQPAVQVDGEGVFLSQVLAVPSNAALPVVRLAAAPAFGQAAVLGRAQIQQAILQLAPELATTNWAGAERVRVTRRARVFRETDLKELLTGVLQQEYVKDRGELELRLTRSWTAVSLPDEPLTLKILDLPTSGVSPMFIVRFELRAAREVLGSWQAPVQARIWKEIWVAHAPLKRGQSLRDDDLVRERRDVLTLRDPLADLSTDDGTLELGENVQAGVPLLARVLKIKPLVHRGQSADALLQDGALAITMKVEILEDGIPGQIVRARNPQSRREIRGKVINEQTILISL